jgi:hypothetical protein
LANVEFNVLAANPSHFAMYTGFFSTSSIIFNQLCEVLASSAEPLSKEKKLNRNKTNKK